MIIYALINNRKNCEDSYHTQEVIVYANQRQKESVSNLYKVEESSMIDRNTGSESV